MAGKAERLDNTSLEMRKGRAASKESCVGGRGGGALAEWPRRAGKKLARWMKIPGKLLGNGVLGEDGKQ